MFALAIGSSLRKLACMVSSGSTGKARRPRILLVDDERAATRILGMLLKKCGYAIAEENHPPKAHMLARKFRPDLIILDLLMPWKTGEDLATIFASDTQLRDVPIIFMTAHVSMEQNISRAFCVLIKPFSLDELLARIKEALGKRFERLAEINTRKEQNIL